MSGLIYLGVGEAVVESPSTTRVARTRLECYDLIESSDLKLSFRQANAGTKTAIRTAPVMHFLMLAYARPAQEHSRFDQSKSRAVPASKLSAPCNLQWRKHQFPARLWTHRYTCRQGSMQQTDIQQTNTVQSTCMCTYQRIHAHADKC